MGMMVWKQGVFKRIVDALLFWGIWNRLRHWSTKTWFKVNGTVIFFVMRLLWAESKEETQGGVLCKMT